MPFHQTNLNDLLALDALLSERHITRAARRCGISQSAMSHALRRLRDTLGDPLLVRGGSGLVCTPRAQQLGEVVSRTLAELREAMFPPPPFEPSTSERCFRIAAVDLMTLPLLVPLLRRLEREAPRCSVSMHTLDPNRYLQQLEDDELDAVILGPEDTRGMRRRALCNEPMVCVLSASHPVLQEPWTRESFASLRHALVMPHDQISGDFEATLRELAGEFDIKLRVPYFVAGALAAVLSGLALVVSAQLAHTVGELASVAIRPLPFDFGPVAIWLVWHPKNDDDAANRWLREAVLDIWRESADADSR